MKNILKFDLYKLVKSKSTWIVFVGIMLVHVLYLVFYYDGGVRGHCGTNAFHRISECG